MRMQAQKIEEEKIVKRKVKVKEHRCRYSTDYEIVSAGCWWAKLDAVLDVNENHCILI